MTHDDGVTRLFDTGATRDTSEGKYDYEGFLSPYVLEIFAAYMHKHRNNSDGSLRDSDNWQKGIPKAVYMKSLWRHHWAIWKLHRSENPVQALMIEALCGIMFNSMGYLHELLKPSPPELVPRGHTKEFDQAREIPSSKSVSGRRYDSKGFIIFND